MPPQVKNITGAEYESVEMSPLTTIGTAGITSLFRDVELGGMGSAALKQLGTGGSRFRRTKLDLVVQQMHFN